MTWSDLDPVDLRVALVVSQLLGLVLTRYALRLEPVTSASVDTVVAAYAPTLRRYLTADAAELVVR